MRAFMCTGATAPRHVEVLLSQNEKKRISISGVSIRRMSELMGHVQCILFSPEDLLLVKGRTGYSKTVSGCVACASCAPIIFWSSPATTRCCCKKMRF